MKSYCFHCKQYYDVSTETQNEEMVISGVTVSASQEHAFCPICGEEITPDEIFDKNIHVAHDAYREAIGSISVTDMEKLLATYDIGASTLSQLLGWGSNSYERSMKHTIPEPEKANQLKALFDPVKMANLLINES